MRRSTVATRLADRHLSERPVVIKNAVSPGTSIRLAASADRQRCRNAGISLRMGFDSGTK